MTILDTLGGIVAAFIVVGFFGGLIYIFLFKAHWSNRPLVSRGIGIAMLAGAIKVVFLVLAENLSSAFDAEWLNYALGAMAGVGVVMMMAGFGDDSR